mmetsp:Transcript_102357/g.161711  ORF Transcript_102357/g.161711 Transcript_102357/m.161711 type:complete len:274 (+) Transcript_102357:834-1655(+)
MFDKLGRHSDVIDNATALLPLIRDLFFDEAALFVHNFQQGRVTFQPSLGRIQRPIYLHRLLEFVRDGGLQVLQIVLEVLQLLPLHFDKIQDLFLFFVESSLDGLTSFDDFLLVRLENQGRGMLVFSLLRIDLALCFIAIFNAIVGLQEGQAFTQLFERHDFLLQSCGAFALHTFITEIRLRDHRFDLPQRLGTARLENALVFPHLLQLRLKIVKLSVGRGHLVLHFRFTGLQSLQLRGGFLVVGCGHITSALILVHGQLHVHIFLLAIRFAGL